MALPWPRFLKESTLAPSGVPLSLYLTFSILWDFYLYLIMVAQLVKKTPARAGDTRDLGSILGLGSTPGNGSSNRLQYSCLGNSRDRRDWLAMVHGVTKRQTQLSVHAHTPTHTHAHRHTHWIMSALLCFKPYLRTWSLTYTSLGLLWYSVQSLSCIRLFATPWTAARQASLSITNSWSPPKPMSIESVMPSNHLILCHPLLLLPSIFPSIRVFSNESALGIRWPKYWSFSFNISPSNEHPGLIFGTR